jgi:hypothetical protein
MNEKRYEGTHGPDEVKMQIRTLFEKTHAVTSAMLTSIYPWALCLLSNLISSPSRRHKSKTVLKAYIHRPWVHPCQTIVGPMALEMSIDENGV